METSEIVRRLDEWARAEMIDHRTGVPPIAKLEIRPSSSFTGGESRTRGFNLDFAFAPSEPDEAIQAVAPRLRTALERDPTMGNRFPAGSVELAGVRALEGSDAEARGVTVRVRVEART